MEGGSNVWEPWQNLQEGETRIDLKARMVWGLDEAAATVFSRVFGKPESRPSPD